VRGLVAALLIAGCAPVWRFDSGAQFPGARGALSIDERAPGRGPSLRMDYDFSRGGRWVAAARRFVPPAAAEAVAFRVRAPLGIRVAVQVVDESGQLLQYNLSRPLGANDPERAFDQLVRLDRPSGSWRGAGDGRPHGGVRVLRVLAADPLAPHRRGSLYVDDVRLVARAPVERIDPGEPARVVEDAAPSWGVKIHFTDDEAALDAARALGFAWVRMDLFWHEVERAPGRFDFASYDRLVSAAEARGLETLLILDYAHPLHSDGPDFAPRSQATVRAFGDLAAAAARFFVGRAVAYEIWNEPNTDFWKPHPDAAAFAALAREAAARIHAVDPLARVCGGGLSTFDPDYLAAFLAAGGGRGLDAVGVHPYRAHGFYEAPESLYDELLVAREQLRRASLAAPLWNTEWGYSVSWYRDRAREPEAAQAALAARLLLTTRLVGFPVSIYYDLRDDGDDARAPEHNFGLLGRDNRLKPAGRAVATLMALLRGRRLAVRYQLATAGLHAARFDGPDDALIAVWSDRDGGERVEIDGPARAVDGLGAPLALDRAGDRVSLTAGRAPIYVTVPRR
jgi:hypothetical protein